MNHHKNILSSSSFLLLVSLSWLLLLFSSSITVVNATGIACNTTKQCEEIIGIGTSSICLESGYCSNPFYNKGCLANLLHTKQSNNESNSNSSSSSSSSSSINKNYIRVCTSNDPPEAVQLGYCKLPIPELNYTEIRFMGNNWESVFFETWILQIILSEILGVPTSVDTGMSDKIVDYYNIDSKMEYGKGFDWESMKNAQNIKDCRKNNIQQSSNNNISEYVGCAHVSLEVWQGQKENVQTLHEEGYVEKPVALGVLATSGWFVPKFTAERDPSLTNYLGLSGFKNRRKLAETFLRPTKWIDYCTNISLTNCTVPDSVAQRPPSSDDESEQNKYFVDGLYTGYFRNTTQNDCDKYGLTCTGHIVDYPCGWSSYVAQLTYHLDIALEANGDEPYVHGYKYGEMVDIWASANATKSNVIMLWWTPDVLFQQYVGTDAEFQRVNFPVPTQVCMENKINPNDRCTADGNANKDLIFGTSIGACEDPPQSLTKIVTNSFYDICYGTDDGNTLPEAMYNPAYEAVQNFEISDLEIGTLFDLWLSKNIDKWQYDPRLAVCEWVVTNYDHIMDAFIPKHYPRIIEDGNNTFRDPLFYVALIIATIVLAVVIGLSISIYNIRTRRVIVLAQVEFLFLLLLGLILVQLGSVILSVPPSNISCIISSWLINMGYTLELVPLIVKIAAINKLMSAARNMKRVKLERKHLFAVVASVTFVIAIYLMVWTILDPWTKDISYELTTETNEYNETIVTVNSYCHSNHIYWFLIALTWRCLLLLVATVLAFQTRKSPVNINESKTLAIMIYSQFVFVVWNLVLFIMDDNNIIPVSNIAFYRSLVISADVCAVCCIYFVPKFLMTDEVFKEQRRASSVNFSFNAISGISQRIQSGTESQLQSDAAAAMSMISQSTPDDKSGVFTNNDNEDCVAPGIVNSECDNTGSQKQIVGSLLGTICTQANFTNSDEDTIKN